MDINRILVPVSFAPSCKRALRTAASLASAFDAKLYVANVYRTPPVLFHSVGGVLFPKVLEQERLDRVAKLDEFIKREMKFLKVSVDVEEINTEDSEPVKAILDIARKNSVDLMVLGHHEESRLERFLFGRNVGRLVDGAPCDVIVTRTNLYKAKEREQEAA